MSAEMEEQRDLLPAVLLADASTPVLLYADRAESAATAASVSRAALEERAQDSYKRKGRVDFALFNIRTHREDLDACRQRV
jgi:hypothetical protein